MQQTGDFATVEFDKEVETYGPDAAAKIAFERTARKLADETKPQHRNVKDIESELESEKAKQKIILIQARTGKAPKKSRREKKSEDNTVDKADAQAAAEMDISPSMHARVKTANKIRSLESELNQAKQSQREKKVTEFNKLIDGGGYEDGITNDDVDYFVRESANSTEERTGQKLANHQITTLMDQGIKDYKQKVSKGVAEKQALKEVAQDSIKRSDDWVDRMKKAPRPVNKRNFISAFASRN